MPWPLSQDYNEAIQNPAQCFADAELRQGEAETNALGLPATRSGNFADVYAVISGQRKWAVKCFTRQIPGLQERYQQISLHLEQVKLPFMVDFTFLERGIRVRGDWYPILKMQWVEGFTLNQFVNNNLDKPQVLDVLCQLWVKLATRLREGNIAHCDLQHGNVLLVPGSKAGALQVKLVDYDGMCVPSLTLLKSIEVGHPAYQHPQRQREGIYSLEVDRFSHLVIYTALRALMVGGKTLWDKHDDGDNLLFKPSDYQAPTRSRVFYEMLKSSSEEGRTLVQVLMQALSGPLNQVPLLESLVTTLPTTAIQATKPAAVLSEKSARGSVAPAQRLAQATQPAAMFAKVTEEAIGPGSKVPRRGRRKKSILVPTVMVLAGLALAAGAIFFVLQGGLKKGPTSDVAEGKTANSTASQQLVVKVNALPKPKSGPEPKPVVETKVTPKIDANPASELKPRPDAKPDSKPAPDPKRVADAKPTPKSESVKPPPAETPRKEPIAPKNPTPSTPDLNTAKVQPAPLVTKKVPEPANPKPDSRAKPAADIDLLKLINPERDAVHGEWLFQGQTLVCRTGGIEDRIGVPYIPPDEYALHIVVERKQGDGCLSVGLIGGGHQFLAQFDAWPGDGYRSGLQLIDNKNVIDQAEAKRGQLLLLAKSTDIRLIVRKSVVLVKVDGHLISSFNGDFSRLSLEDAWAIPNRHALFLGNNSASFHITKMNLIRISGLGKVLAETKGDSRQPVPRETDLAASLSKIKEAHKEAYKGRKPSQMDGLATRLLKQALETGAGSPLQFVLLREARDLSADAGNAALAVQAVREMAKTFEVKELDDKVAALERAGRSKAAINQQLLFNTTLAVIEEAVSVENFDAAQRLLKVAAGSVPRSGKKALQTMLQKRTGEIDWLRQEHDKAAAAMSMLAVNPNDAAANLVVGQYRCFGKDDWDNGLPYLARGSDPALATLASKELELPGSLDAQVGLGDAWWTHADKGAGVEKTGAQRRAYFWYLSALPRLTGPEEIRVEKRAEILAVDVPGLQSPWDNCDTSAATSGPGFFRLRPGTAIVTKRAFSRPIIITAVARTERNNIRLHAFGGGEVIFNWEGNAGELRVHRPEDPTEDKLGSLAVGKQVPLTTRTWHLLRWRITEHGMDVTVDGVVVFAESGNYILSNRRPVRIFAHDSIVDVKMFTVTPIR